MFFRETLSDDAFHDRIDWIDESCPHQEDAGETGDGAHEESRPPICLRSVALFCHVHSRFIFKRISSQTFLLCLGRMGGAGEKAPPIDHLPVIGMDETVHDPVRGREAVSSEQQRVPVEDDLIGARASIVYEDRLRQLLSFLVLPVDSCPGRRKTGEVCGRVAPFDVRTSWTGTATSVEWVSVDCHRITVSEHAATNPDSAGLHKQTAVRSLM